MQTAGNKSYPHPLRRRSKHENSIKEGDGVSEVININGYETDIAELTDMAQRWSAKDIAREFEITSIWVHRLLKKYDIIHKDARGTRKC